MKIYKLDLLTLLIGLFILGSCNNPDEIGLDPNNNVNTSIDETSTVKAFTVPEDKIETNALSKYPIGYLVDPLMGITQSAVGATINLPSDALTFGTNVTLDSAILVLKYADSFYGDSDKSVYHFKVHQLTNKLSTDSHYNTTPIAYNPTILGELTVNEIKLYDSVKVKQIVKGAKDTELKQAPQIRIPLSKDFINTNFINASADKFATSAAFVDYFKGLYLKVDPMSGSEAGGIPFFDLSSGASKLELYYRNVNATIDTNYVVFTIANGSSPVLANFKHDYTGTAVETQLNNPSLEYNQTFVQALAGVRTKITFPDLNLLKNKGKLVINKAELVVSIDGANYVTPFEPAPRLIAYQTDIAAQRKLIPDLNPYDVRFVGIAGFGGGYNSTSKTYTFNISAYIQDILSGESKQYALYLAPSDLVVNNLTAAISPSSTVAGRSVLGSGKSANFKMKLRVKYTLVSN